MQRAVRETAAWKPYVQLGDTEGKHRFDAPVPAFNLFDLRVQSL